MSPAKAGLFFICITMFNVFEELSWPQFAQLEHIKKLPLNEQVNRFNMYIQDLSIARLNMVQDQPKGDSYLLQEDGFFLLQEDGSKISLPAYA